MASELNGKRRGDPGRGRRTELLSLHDGFIQARNNDLEAAGTFDVDALVRSASVEDYDALLLPGGTVNPDKLRVDEAAVSFVRDFMAVRQAGRAICHGPWTLLEAGVVSGRISDVVPQHPHRPAQRRCASSSTKMSPGTATWSPAARQTTYQHSAPQSSSRSRKPTSRRSGGRAP